MARRFRFKAKKVNIPRVVSKIAGTILALYAGGLVVTTLGDVMKNTASPFYKGLTLIGWTVGYYPMYDEVNYASDCAGTINSTAATPLGENCLTATSGAGVLAIVGLIGIASIVMEFVEFRLR